MALQWSALRSRVARRLVLALLVATLLPIGALALVVYSHLSAQLIELSEDRLHTATRDTGLALLGRIQDAETLLREVGASPGDDAERWPALLRSRAEASFTAIARTSGSEVTMLFGEEEHIRAIPDDPPEVAEAPAHLTTSASAQGASVTLRVGNLPGGGMLLGVLNPDTLFDITPENTLPPLAEYCVLNERRAMIRCSLEGLTKGPLARSLRPRRSDSRSFEWQHGGVDYFARQWAVFLGPQFGVRAWTIVVAEPKHVALAPVATFRQIFPLAILGTALLVTGFVLVEIRRRLAPLAVLRSGTERIAAQDFSQPIPVTGDDEFADVARSFNSMAGQLDAHLAQLARLIELDRDVLATQDLDTLGQTLVQGVLDLSDVDLVAFVAVAPDRSTPPFGYVAARGSGKAERFEDPDFAGLELPPNGTEADWIALERGAESNATLRQLARRRATAALLLPLRRGDQTVGLIACAYEEAPAKTRAVPAFLARVVDQAGQALGNVYAMEEKRVLAYYDALTSLPNRLMFQERLSQALGQAQRDGRSVGLLMIDLDRCKQVNDTLGHVEGDALLCAVAERLTPHMRDGSLARLGGDEFTVVLRDVANVESAARVANKILELLSEPIEIPGHVHRVSASIGVAVSPDDGHDAETLLRNADTAMYAAKSAGGGAFQLFARHMHDRAVERMQLERALRDAVPNDELVLHYQPVIDLRSARIVSAEALVRWELPGTGLVPPDRFIPIAEETEIIHALGEWVLRRACADNQHWQAQGLERLRIAVNVSGRQLSGANLQTKVKRALVDHQLYPQYLGLELTETSIMESDEHGAHVLQELSRMGVALSMDDFGTGYSSLAYLRRFPFDHLKIDRSFVQDLETSSEAQAIVRAILAMTRSLGLRTVAEGIETTGQRDWLRSAGCDAAQGYLFSRPVPAEAFEKLLRQQSEADEA